MTISLEQIRMAFADLIQGVKSREEISNWAVTLREAEDSSTLVYDPPEAESLIWEAILYLEGVDLKDAPDSYLHTVDDFNDYVRDTLGKG